MIEINKIPNDKIPVNDSDASHHRPIIILTPFKGDVCNLTKLDAILHRQLAHEDQWVIVFDHQKPEKIDFKCKKNIQILENNEKPGAGNTRNIGLRFIKQKYCAPFILYPLDSDDLITDDALDRIRTTSEKCKEKILSFGHLKAWQFKTVRVCYDGKYNLRQLLKRYITPCGSTVLKVDNMSDIIRLKFGERIRANDQLFFLKAVQENKYVRCIPEIILIYQIKNKNSVSYQKYKMVIYKYFALRDFGLGRVSAIYYLIFYALYGSLRHIFKVGI